MKSFYPIFITGTILLSGLGLVQAMPVDPSIAELLDGTSLEQDGQPKHDVVETALSRRILMLLEKHEDAKAFELLRAMFTYKRQQQYKKCIRLLAPSICKNNNPQPFYLWAQVAARDLTGEVLGGLKDRLLAHAEQ